MSLEMKTDAQNDLVVVYADKYHEFAKAQFKAVYAIKSKQQLGQHLAHWNLVCLNMNPEEVSENEITVGAVENGTEHSRHV
jgi:hypothetical protein